MNDSVFVPFDLSEDKAEEFLVLRESLSAGARQLLLGWVRQVITKVRDRSLQAVYYEANTVLCRDIQLHTEVWLGVGNSTYHNEDNVIKTLAGANDIEILRVIDYLLSVGKGQPNEIDRVLTGARSKWRTGEVNGNRRLVARVPDGVQDAAETTAKRGNAGRLLARAWAGVHGIEPNASGSYSDAIRAVEVAAISKVMSSDSTATLGKVIGQMEADADWSLPLREHAKAPSSAMILGMLRTIWFGHRDRHGASDYTDVSLDEARAAVALAVTLIDWFESGAITRRNGATNEGSIFT